MSGEIKISIPRLTAAGFALPLLKPPGLPSFELKEAFMGHRSIANTVISTAVADKRVRNIWGK